MSNDSLLFTDKVVIVTGAGGGLGRCYALMFAERGAKVVVNDLGGSMTGDGKGTAKAADVVVEEIRAKNGIAVANYDSVEDGEKIVNTAIENFGRIDILINNAGILRDKSFLRTSDVDWDLIHRIHLRASFILTRAAWPHMQKNKFGRVIMTSSGAGIYGNFGQANYSAAKLGLLGLSNTLSIEGQKYNIRCNTIAPVAKSRLTATVMPEDILDILKAEYVAPLVLYLCHESTEETGSLFEVGGGWIGKVRWQKSGGAVVIKDGAMTCEMVRDKWNQITSFDNPLYHTSISEASNHCINAIENEKTLSSSPENVSSNGSSGSSTTNQGSSYRYDFKDVILYNLSLGISTADENNLKFLNENHEKFAVLPTFGVIPAFTILFDHVASLKLPNDLQIDPAKILHGEQYLELLKPLPTNGTFSLKPKLVDVLDKGSGATLILNIDLFNEKDERVAFNQFVTFVVGAGNFGGKRDSAEQIKPHSMKFDRKPDAVVEEKTDIDQAALYRLNGDFNPLHIDPNFSMILGFNKPILHGLCSFGFAVKHVIQKYCDNDVSLFKAVKARFTKPVIPGQTLQTSMWIESSNPKRVYFETKVVENQSVVISGAYVDLHDIKQGATNSTALAQNETSAEKFASDAIFDELALKLKADPSIAKAINAVYLFRLSKGPSTKVYLVDLKQGSISEKNASDDVKCDCTIMIKDEDFISLANGSGNPQQMFMKGKLKVKGNITLAQKLDKLFKANSKL